MASKSKKRRRVLGASCILAALIIAGSSFAWFTSKDEVTNRLTASSDYGVSIVESFAPPANWLPGQEINKDVYAVNTGNIEAFVKEELSGVLDYSYETTTVLFDPTTCVELLPMAEEEIDGATTNEAGAFLAWTDVDGVKTGYVNSARNEDVTNGDASNAWHPTETGHYIFRRTVKKNTEGNDEFTYAGYYYVKGTAAVGTENEPGYVPAVPEKYYKIIIGKDAYRAANDGADTPVKDADGSVRYEFDIKADQSALVKPDGATVITPAADGSFTDAPLINYVKVVDVDPTDVSFEYKQETTKYDNAPYLAVRFSNAAGDLNAKQEELDKAQKALDDAKAALAEAQEAAAKDTHDLAELEVTYRNAEYAYYTALSRYNKTLADMTYANKLIEETNKLYPIAANRANAEEQMKKLKEAMEDAAKAVRAEANKEQGEENAADGVGASDLMAENYNAVKTAMLNGSTGIGKMVLVPEEIRTLINNNINADPVGGSDLAAAKQNLEVLDSIWAQIAGADGDGNGGILKKITEDYDKFQATVAVGNKETDTDPAVLDNDDPKGYLQDLKADLDRLETLLVAYANAYTEFTDSARQEASLTHLVNANETKKSDIQGYSKGDTDTDGKINKLEAKAVNETDGLKKIIADYNAAYEAYYNYMDSSETNTEGYYAKVKAWNDAVNTYNTNVNGDGNADSAKAKYDAAIAVVQSTKNNALVDKTITDASGDWTLVNDGLYLVNGFSARSVGNVTGENAAADNNLAERGIGASGTAVSMATEDSSDKSKSTADPRITSATDTNYLNFVVANTGSDVATKPYVAMTDVTQRVKASFLQKEADPTTRQTLEALETSLGNATSGATQTYNTAKHDYEEKYNAVKTTTEGLTTLAKAVETAEARKTAVTNANASDNRNSNIKIDVVLDKNVVKSSAQESATGATWVFDEDTDKTQTPTFYYNRVLDAGKTSEKLVDKLVFCDDVKASDYKDLQFDLNVALDSMQVTYDPQNNTEMTATAVNASDDFDMTAAITDQTDKEDVKVKWSDKVAVPTVYKVGDVEVTVTDLKPDDSTDNTVTVGATNYRYKVTVGGKNYYGVAMPEKGAKANFYQIDTTVANNPKLVTGEGSIVEVTAE